VSATSTLLPPHSTAWLQALPVAPSQKSQRRAKCWIAFGIFFIVLATYVVSGPGRIDITDGQVRYDVAYNWLVEGRPVFRNPWLKQQSVPGRDGQPYSLYGAPASVFSMPLVWWGIHLDDSSRETSRFLFSFTSAIFGAGVAVVLFLFYVELGIFLTRALAWTMVTAFATLLWPSSCSTFENAQRAFFAMTAVYLGYLSAKRESNLLAVAGGLTASALLLYQEYHLFILPALAICTLRFSKESTSCPKATLKSSPWSWLLSAIREYLHKSYEYLRAARHKSGDERASCIRFALWLSTAVIVGLSLSFAYNHLRFGSSVQSGRMERASPLLYFGNPVSGFATLLLSPGKSVVLYSPPLILGILGSRHLRRRQPEISSAIGLASLVLVIILSYLLFAGGDWCWGPRYLMVLLPLWSLAFPFMRLQTSLRRTLLALIVGLGLIVQVLALSVENQKFFFAHALDDDFYAQDDWAYFKHSALFSRIGEAISLGAGPPATAKFFTSVPIPRWSTHCILGPPPWMPRSVSPEWMKSFKIYYLPRPWPLWMRTINPVLRPVNVNTWLKALALIFLTGIAFICLGLQSMVKIKPASGESNCVGVDQYRSNAMEPALVVDHR
jgi:hypothetical protein